MSSRTILAMWWLFTLIIFSTYTADLTSFLTVKSDNKLIASLDELAASPDHRVLIPKGTIVDTLLSEAKTGAYAKLNKKKEYIQTIDECGDIIASDAGTGLGCMTDYTFLLFIAKRRCSKVYLVPELFNAATVGFMSQKDAYFRDVFDMHTRKLVESGMMERWFRQYYSADSKPGGDVCEGSTDSEADAVSLESLGGAYILTYSLYGAGIFMLFFEFIWTKVVKRSPLDFPCF